MLLKKLRIKNLRSHKDTEVNFPEGSTLFSGDIGSGKTSVLLAVEFALFGLQPGQKGNSLLRNNENEASVVLEFEVDEKLVRIERSIKKTGKSMGQADTAITVNNERFEGSVTEIKNKILEILNYPPEFAKKTNDLFRFTVYTPQEEMKQIIQESNDVRLNTLRHVFGIDKYKRIEENIAVLTSKIRQEIRVKEAGMGNPESKKQQLLEKNSQILVQEEEIRKVEKEIENVQKIKNDKQQEIDDLTNKMNEKNKLENEKEKSELTLNNKKDMVITYDKEIKLLNEQVKAVSGFNFSERDIESAKNRIIAQEKEIKEFNEKYIQLATSLQGNESKARELHMLIQKISSIQKCTACLQIVNEEHKHNIVLRASQDIKEIDSSINHEKKEKKETSDKLEQARKMADSMKQSLSQLEILKVRLESINEKKARAIQLEKQKTAVHGDIEMMKKHIEGLETLLKEFNMYDMLYEKKNRELKEISGKENSFMMKKVESSTEIQFLGKQVQSLKEEIKQIEEMEKKLNHMREMEFWLNNKFLQFVLFTEKNVMLKLREEFSQLFSSWFSVLVSDTISVRLDESFSPIIQQADYDIEYDYLSGGERTAVALAYRLALNQTINSLLSRIKTRDIVILDEPTDGFSESQLDKMRDVLNQLKVRQLILVSHEQKIEGFVNSIIKFKKVDGVTEIEK